MRKRRYTLTPEQVRAATEAASRDHMPFGLGYISPTRSHGAGGAGVPVDERMVDDLMAALLGACGPVESRELVRAIRGACGNRAAEAVNGLAEREGVPVAVALRTLLERLGAAIEVASLREGKDGRVREIEVVPVLPARLRVPCVSRRVNPNADFDGLAPALQAAMERERRKKSRAELIP